MKSLRNILIKKTYFSIPRNLMRICFNIDMKILIVRPMETAGLTSVGRQLTQVKVSEAIIFLLIQKDLKK